MPVVFGLMCAENTLWDQLDIDDCHHWRRLKVVVLRLFIFGRRLDAVECLLGVHAAVETSRKSQMKIQKKK